MSPGLVGVRDDRFKKRKNVSGVVSGSGAEVLGAPAPHTSPSTMAGDGASFVYPLVGLQACCTGGS